MTPLYAIGRVILIPLVKILFFLKVNGKENIPKNGGFILCSNHLSNFDPVLIGVAQRRQLFFMAKSELFRNKFFGWLIRKLGAFPVERGAGDGKAINTAEKIINEGKTLGIFIEGTRSKTGELLRPKAGAAMIAQQTKADVVPVCITPKNKKIRVFSKVTVSIGKPISYEQLGLEESSPQAYRNASKMIMGRITEMRMIDSGKKILPEGNKK